MRPVPGERKVRHHRRGVQREQRLDVVQALDGRVDMQLRQRPRPAQQLLPQAGQMVVFGHAAVGFGGIDVRVDQRMREHPGRDAAEAGKQREQQRVAGDVIGHASARSQLLWVKCRQIYG